MASRRVDRYQTGEFSSLICICAVEGGPTLSNAQHKKTCGVLFEKTRAEKKRAYIHSRKEPGVLCPAV